MSVSHDIGREGERVKLWSYGDLMASQLQCGTSGTTTGLAKEVGSVAS